jgi:hypothetical protein
MKEPGVMVGYKEGNILDRDISTGKDEPSSLHKIII